MPFDESHVKFYFTICINNVKPEYYYINSMILQFQMKVMLF